MRPLPVSSHYSGEQENSPTYGAVTYLVQWYGILAGSTVSMTACVATRFTPLEEGNPFQWEILDASIEFAKPIGYVASCNRLRKYWDPTPPVVFSLQHTPSQRTNFR